jgi:ubiquinone/menaquinone biosynthesis C-methylase UbiE
MLDSNHHTYTARRVVHHYTQLSQLQPAEQSILELLRGQWSKMKMLDIGVGGGRTTTHFSKLVMDYVGIDYSTDMIAACQKRFSISSPGAMFEVCDARDMSRFEDNSFDFILFSFNGIDSISHTDRLQVFQEVKRVGKPGGYFFFSSHNLQGIEQELNWRYQLSCNPLTTYVNLVMLGLLRLFNRSLTRPQLKAVTYSIIKDESHNFRLKTYYIRPLEQINQLTPDFSQVKAYSWKNGLELTHEKELCENVDLWLYYLCIINP